MKYFILFSFLICFVSTINAQLFPETYPDTIDALPTEDPEFKVTSVHLEGDYHELVISVAFPNRTSYEYPKITQVSHYPKNGTFAPEILNGIALEDYLIAEPTHSISMELWYGPALNKYFNTLSGGIYTVDFNFVKNHAGNRFHTFNSWDYFVAQNNGSSVSVIYNKKQIILNDVAEEIHNEFPYIFDNIDCIHFTFEGLTGDEFWKGHGGTVYSDFTLTGSDGTELFSGSISIQIDASAIAHERLHIIGAISHTTGFLGLPDRGFDTYYLNAFHYNIAFSYDIMYHNSSFVHKYSLYGTPPLISHDLIFFGWIKPEEILEVDANNYSQYDLLKLADINYPLTEQQLSDGYKRIIRVMVKKNYSGNHDEYFLIENHQATEFDKAFGNYDEYPLTGYNKGILVWHIKERVNSLNQFLDNYIDLEVAVPYNAFLGNPIPPDPYYTDYGRNGVLSGMIKWNDSFAEDYDYLDDGCMYEQHAGQNDYIYKYVPDGGRHEWEITVPPPHPWYPLDPNVFTRLESMSSDFFNDAMIKGHITNKISDATRPSTKTWGNRYIGTTTYPSEKTHIAIKNIKREDGYMSLRVLYNYWEGEVVEDATMSGQVIIGDNLTVNPGVILSIEGDTKISFDNEYTDVPNYSKLNVYGAVKINGGDCEIASNGYLKLEPGSRIEFTPSSQLLVEGVLDAVGTLNDKIVFDRSDGEGTWGALYFRGASSSNSILDNVEIKNGAGIKCVNGANITIQNSLIDHCTNGIYIYNAAPGIFNNSIIDPYNNGIYGESLGGAPFIKGNTIKKITNNLYNYQGIYFTNNDAATHITGNDIQGFSYGYYFTGGGETYFHEPDNIFIDRNNRFTNCRIGFCAAWGSFIMAGSPGNPPWSANNSIERNSNYDAAAYGTGRIHAEYDWWDIDGPQLLTLSGGIINATNPLDYDPWDEPKENIIVNKNPLNPEGGGDDILLAISLEQQGRIEELIGLCKQMIRQNSSINFAISELLYVKIKYRIINIRDYLDSLLIGNRPFKAKLLYFLAGLSLYEGKYNIAVFLYNRIINEFPGRREAIDALFEKYFAVLNYGENRELAGQLLSDLQSLGINDEDFLMRLDMAESLYDESGGNQMGKPNNNTEINEPMEYALFDNFPNPFNPSTTINYQLPQTGFVTLKIYDILGKEVVTLVNEQKTRGRYSVNYDASRLASGVYIYQIRVNDYVGSKKMILVK